MARTSGKAKTQARGTRSQANDAPPAVDPTAGRVAELQRQVAELTQQLRAAQQAEQTARIAFSNESAKSYALAALSQENRELRQQLQSRG